MDISVEGEPLFLSVDESFDRMETGMILEAILKDESEMNRAICFMYHADGMTLKEIGDAVGLSVTGVYKRLEAFKSRAKLKLKFREEI